MSERLHSKNTPAAESRFKDQLAFLSYLLEVSPGPKSLVGGMALEDHVYPYRANGTSRDIDIVSFYTDPNWAPNILNSVELLRSSSDPDFPEVGLEAAHISDSPMPYSLLSALSGMRVASDGRAFMTYRGIEKEMPPETLETTIHLVNGIGFQAFPKMTLLWRYILRGATIKPKDEIKVIKLALEIMSDSKEQPDLKYYRPYLEFISEIRETYPHVVGLYTLFWTLDKVSGGRISGAKGAFYDMIPWFRS